MTSLSFSARAHHRILKVARPPAPARALGPGAEPGEIMGCSRPRSSRRGEEREDAECERGPGGAGDFPVGTAKNGLARLMRNHPAPPALNS